MRKAIITLTILLSFAAGEGLYGQSKLTIPEDIFHFGYVPQHAKVSHVFWLYSTGVDTLVIDEIRPGCGCTKAPLEKYVLPPGDSTRLEIIYSTQNYRRKQAKHPRILSNAVNKEEQVSVVANVLMYPDSAYPIVIKPPRLDFVQTDPNNSKEVEFTLTNISDEDLKLLPISINETIFDVKLPRKLKAGQSRSAVIKVNRDYLDREIEKSITFELSDKEQTRYTVPVRQSVPNISGDK
jgi:hypothetical protein